MKELVNFSVYAHDLAHFGGDWDGLAAFVGDQGLDGIELLLSYDVVPGEVPAELANGVHLPLWTTWLDIWRGVEGAASHYYPDPAWAAYYAGGVNGDEMVATLIQLLEMAAGLKAHYAVVHVAHVEIQHAWTRAYTYTDGEVIDAFAAFLNAVAAACGGEPPVRLFLENVWWPGLTFTDGEAAERLARRLQFDNWAFLLDTAHLMNTCPDLKTESGAINFVLRTLANLPRPVLDRIECVHLNLSLSGAYQRTSRQLPEGYDALSFAGQFDLARDHVGRIDQHLPFTDPRCREIAKGLNPAFVVHEVFSHGGGDPREKVAAQCRAFWENAGS